jgi:hypothetical protein
MVYLYILIAGVILLLTGLVFLLRRQLFFRKGITTVATVARLEETFDSKGQPRYTPILQYAVSNVAFTYEHSFKTNVGKWTAGQKVKLVYDPTRPWKAGVVNFTYSFSTAVALIAVSFALILIGCNHTWHNKKAPGASEAILFKKEQ